MRSDKQRVWLIYAGLGLVTLAVFWPVTHFDFINYDDPDYVTENPTVRAGLTWAGLHWAFAAQHASNWHPLTWLSHMLDCQLFGLQAGRHHLTNLLFHTANTLLLFGVLRRMTGAVWRSALVAALFGWHPLHVESVAWVSERKDVLSVFFGLLTLGAYTDYVQRTAARNRRAWLSYVLALLCFAAALLGKAMLVGLPFVLCLLDYWPLRRIGLPARPSGPGSESTPVAVAPGAGAWRRLALEKVPFVIVMLISCVMTYRAQNQGGAMNSLELVPLGLRVTNAIVAYARYVIATIWPVDLAVFYPLPTAWSLAVVGGAGLLLALISGSVAFQFRLRPYLIVGWLWFLETLGPVIGLVQVGTQSMADRYTYLPLIGLFLAVAWGLGDLPAGRSGSRMAVRVGVGAGLLVLIALTAFQVQIWKNTMTLFTHAVAVTKDNYEAYDSLGVAQLNAGHYDEAMTNFNAALAIQPNSYLAHFHVGIIRYRLGNHQAAREEFERSLRGRSQWPSGNLYLGSVLAGEGKLAEALGHYETTLRGEPENLAARQEAGRALAQLGRFDEALAQFQRVVQLNPAEPQSHYDLALALVMAGRQDQAISPYRAALRLRPNWPEALNNLAWLLATRPQPAFRDGAEAVRLAERACELTGRKDARYLGTLDAAYAEAGRFPEAITTARKARELAAAAGLPDVAAAAGEREKRYRTGQPYREP